MAARTVEERIALFDQKIEKKQSEIEALENWCKENGHPMSLSQVWAKGGELYWQKQENQE